MKDVLLTPVRIPEFLPLGATICPYLCEAIHTIEPEILSRLKKEQQDLESMTETQRHQFFSLRAKQNQLLRSIIGSYTTEARKQSEERHG